MFAVLRYLTSAFPSYTENPSGFMMDILGRLSLGIDALPNSPFLLMATNFSPGKKFGLTFLYLSMIICSASSQACWGVRQSFIRMII